MNPYAEADFESFWPHYLRMHCQRGTQRLHAVATASAVLLVALGLVRHNPWVVALAPLVDHLVAQAAHRGVEGNRTKPWRHPAWHLRAELRLFWLVVTGRIDAEMLRLGVR